MASHNVYSEYKRDTRHLLYWIINTSNGLIRSPPFLKECNGSAGELNKSGQTTCGGLCRHVQAYGQAC